MLRIIGRDIELTRGDTARISITIKTKSGQNYELKSGDVLEITMRQYADRDSKELLHKVIPNDDQAIIFSSEDTGGLECGDYVYDVQLTLLNGDVNTVIPPSRITICKEVTM